MESGLLLADMIWYRETLIRFSLLNAYPNKEIEVEV